MYVNSHLMARKIGWTITLRNNKAKNNSSLDKPELNADKETISVASTMHPKITTGGVYRRRERKKSAHVHTLTCYCVKKLMHGRARMINGGTMGLGSEKGEGGKEKE